MIRGLRGATTVAQNVEQEMLENTLELIKVMIDKNQLQPENVSHVFISVTQDLNATFPAKVLREIPGWSHVPVMCMTEIDVPAGLKKCIRIMMAVETDIHQQDIEHIYLNDAVKLRPDLMNATKKSSKITAKKQLNRLNSYQQGMQTEDVKKKYNLSHIVKLSSNENPYGYSSKVADFLKEKHFDLALYPDGYTGELRQELAAFLSVDEDELVFGSGSDELVQIISRTYLTNSSHVIMATPTFPQYRHHAIIEGASYTEVPNLVDGSHDLQTMLESIKDTTKVIWICNPNNPTGSVIEKARLLEFIRAVPKHILIVLDEAYYEYVSSESRLDSISLLEDHENIIVLRTFSKAYGLAGLRIGYGIGNKSVIHDLNIVRGPFNTSSISQEAAKIALNDKQFLQDVASETAKVRNAFCEFLTEIGWDYYPSESNFVLVKTPVDDQVVFEYLLENGFIVRPGSKLGKPNTVRITIGKEDDMRKLMKIIKQFAEV